MAKPRAPASPPPVSPAFGLTHRIEIADVHAHLFRVTLTIPRPDALQRLSLPVWIPGSYLVREFSKNLQGLRARQAARALPAGQLRQLDKCSWEVCCNPDKPLQLMYEVYAN
ncbi:MAG: peptidase M61, partial [Polaromonas sp.]|nr:peptidase M61 [Polaromonas sp.]